MTGRARAAACRAAASEFKRAAKPRKQTSLLSLPDEILSAPSWRTFQAGMLSAVRDRACLKAISLVSKRLRQICPSYLLSTVLYKPKSRPAAEPAGPIFDLIDLALPSGPQRLGTYSDDLQTKQRILRLIQRSTLRTRLQTLVVFCTTYCASIEHLAACIAKASFPDLVVHNMPIFHPCLIPQRSMRLVELVGSHGTKCSRDWLPKKQVAHAEIVSIEKFDIARWTEDWSRATMRRMLSAIVAALSQPRDLRLESCYPFSSMLDMVLLSQTFTANLIQLRLDFVIAQDVAEEGLLCIHAARLPCLEKVQT